MATESFELTGKNIKIVEKQIREYLDKYPFPGYGTNIKDPKYIPERKLWVATGTRSNSCD